MTVRDHINSLIHIKNANVYLLNNRGNIPNFIDLESYDCIIIHYSLIMCSDHYISPLTRKKLKNFSGIKICFIQDEYRWVNKTKQVIKDLGINVIFTVVPESKVEKVYPTDEFPAVKKKTILTGYIPDYLQDITTRKYSQREVDIFYRGRPLPPWLGRLGYEKIKIAKFFQEIAKNYNLKVDISYLEEGRLYGKDWVRALSGSKSCLGTESGSSIVDFDGKIEQLVKEFLKNNSEASFEKIHAQVLKKYEGNVVINTISPRIFEAIVLRTLLILYEGHYSGILRPWEHYVPLKKDHSNIDEILEVIKDNARAEKIIENAYNTIALNPQFFYKHLTEIVGEEIQKALKTRILKRNKNNLGWNNKLIYLCHIFKTTPSNYLREIKHFIVQKVIQFLVFLFGAQKALSYKEKLQKIRFWY